MASLLVTPYDSSIALLYNSDTTFTLPILLAASIIIFFCANLAAGLGLSGGMVQPMFLVGGVWGRLIGNFVNSYISTSATPGLYALVGSAGFIGGLMRSTISFTVILIEVSGQLHLILPIMFAMMLGKTVGDRISSLSFYHMNMHLKNYPFIERSATRITRLLVAKQVMSPKVKLFPEMARVKDVVDTLMSCPHSGFPIVDSQGMLQGTILRRHLLILLSNRVFAPLPNNFRVLDLPCAHLFIENVHRIRDTEKICTAVVDKDYDQMLDLRPFINRTPTTVTPQSRVYYIHDLIRALGLRHVIVTDTQQKVMGVITRKDVMEWSLQCVIDGEAFDWTKVQVPGAVWG